MNTRHERGNLLYRESDTGKITVTLTACPACGKRFDADKPGGHQVNHIATHRPSDFGLSPLKS